jgi:hypothetical protein
VTGDLLKHSPIRPSPLPSEIYQILTEILSADILSFPTLLFSVVSFPFSFEIPSRFIIG